MDWLNDIFTSIGDFFSAPDASVLDGSIGGGDFGGDVSGGYNLDGIFGGGDYLPDFAGELSSPFDFSAFLDGSIGGGDFGADASGGYLGDFGGDNYLPDFAGELSPLGLVDSLAPGTGGTSVAGFAGPSGPDSYVAGGGMNAGGTSPIQMGSTIGASEGGSGVQTKDMLDKALEQIKNNPLAAAGLALGAGNIGMQFLKKPDPNEAALKALTERQRLMGENAEGQANALLDPLARGAPLPVGAQAAIDAKRKAAEAAARSQFAGMGLGKSTMAQSAIQQAGQQALTDEFAVKQQMARTGSDILNGAMRAMGGSTQGYDRILRQQLQEDRDFSEALAGLARSLGSFGQRPVVYAR